MLLTAGFRLVDEGAKRDLYEKAGVTYALGKGSNSRNSIPEIRSIIRKADRAAQQARDRRTKETSQQIVEILELYRTTGRPLVCSVCYTETGFHIEGPDVEWMWSHLKERHPLHFGASVEAGVWKRVGIGEDGKYIVPPPKKDREYWLRRTEELISKLGITHVRDLRLRLNQEGYRSSSGKAMDDSRIWSWLDEMNLHREARGDRPLVVAGERPAPEPAAELPAPPVPEVVAVASPPAPPVLKETAEQEPSQRRRKQLAMERRLPLWRRIAAMHDIENKGFDVIAGILNDEGTLRAAGDHWQAYHVSQAYRGYHRMRDLLKLPKPKATGSTPPPGPDVPEYVRAIMDAPALEAAQKVAAIKAIYPKLPASVALMLEDQELPPATRLAILGVVLRG